MPRGTRSMRMSEMSTRMATRRQQHQNGKEEGADGIGQLPCWTVLLQVHTRVRLTLLSCKRPAALQDRLAGFSMPHVDTGTVFSRCIADPGLEY